MKYLLIFLLFGCLGPTEVVRTEYVFIDPDTHRIALINHSVTENPDIDRVTWTFDEFQKVEGLLIPAKMTFYAGWNPDNPGDGASFTIEEVSSKRSDPRRACIRPRRTP